RNLGESMFFGLTSCESHVPTGICELIQLSSSINPRILYCFSVLYGVKLPKKSLHIPKSIKIRRHSPVFVLEYLTFYFFVPVYTEKTIYEAIFLQIFYVE